MHEDGARLALSGEIAGGTRQQAEAPVRSPGRAVGVSVSPPAVEDACLLGLCCGAGPKAALQHEEEQSTAASVIGHIRRAYAFSNYLLYFTRRCHLPTKHLSAHGPLFDIRVFIK